MYLASTVLLDDILADLARQRRVFHSEADFQHAFAWQVHVRDPQMHVRLETHPEPNVRLDLMLSRPDLNSYSAVELKYKTALWSGVENGEAFALKNHGAQDIGGYDIVKDVERVERFTLGRSGWNGAVVVLTNDASYWRSPGHGRVTNADAFRVYEGLVLEGSRQWGPNTGDGTMKNRHLPLELRGRYTLAWRDYSRVTGTRNSTFRLLVVPVDTSEA